MISSRSLEFFVDRKTPRAGGVSIIGRCLKDDIEIGDQFYSVHAMTISEGERIHVRSVSLRVDRIEWWPQGTVDKLASGLNGRIDFSGEGGGLLIDGADIISSDI